MPGATRHHRAWPWLRVTIAVSAHVTASQLIPLSAFAEAFRTGLRFRFPLIMQPACVITHTLRRRKIIKWNKKRTFYDAWPDCISPPPSLSLSLSLSLSSRDRLVHRRGGGEELRMIIIASGVSKIRGCLVDKKFRKKE